MALLSQRWVQPWAITVAEVCVGCTRSPADLMEESACESNTLALADLVCPLRLGQLLRGNCVPQHEEGRAPHGLKLEFLWGWFSSPSASLSPLSVLNLEAGYSRHALDIEASSFPSRQGQGNSALLFRDHAFPDDSRVSVTQACLLRQPDRP